MKDIKNYSIRDDEGEIITNAMWDPGIDKNISKKKS